nr:hypothetical protein [Tanacetum cinerariifolium]
MGRDTVQLETAVNTISHAYLLEFTSEYGIPETLHPELPGPVDRIVDFPEGKVGVYTRVDVIQQKAWEEHSPMLHQATGLSQKLEQPLLLDRRESVPERRGLADECLQRRDAGWEQVFHRGRSGAGYTSYPHPKTTGDATVFNMDLFNLIRAPNPTKVKTGSRPRTPHEVPLLTLTASRVIEMDAPAAATDSSGVPSTIERSPLDFAHEAGASNQGTVASEMPPSEDVPATDAPVAGQAEETAATDPPAAPESRKRCRKGSDVNAPPKSLRRDHADPRASRSSRGGKVLLPYNWVWRLLFVCLVMLLQASVTQIRCPSLTLRHAIPLMLPSLLKVLLRQKTRSLRMLPLLRSGLRREAKLLRKYVAQVARRDKRIHARELEKKNLEALREAETNTKKASEDKSVGLSQELENMHARFSNLQVSNECLSQQVATLQQQVSREEKPKAAFEEFKRQQDDRVEQRCAEMEARLDALSIDFDEELYPHMLTAIASRRWVIGRGLRLAVMKCGESLELRQAFADAVSTGIAKGLSEGLRHGLEHGQAQLSLESIEAYDPEAEAKFVT